KVKNTGELDLSPGEEGYTVRLLLMKKDASGNYVVDRVVAQKAIDQALAVGAESGGIILSGALDESSVTPEEGATSNGHRYDVDECITNTSKILGNYEAVPYQPIPALSDANGKAIEADGEINMSTIKGGDTYTVSLANNGAAPMNVTSVAVTGDLCTISGENTFTIAKHESKEVELTISSSVTGEKEGTITFSGEGFEPLTYTLKANVIDPSLWFVNFEDGKIPDDMIAQGEWTADKKLAIPDNKYYAVNNNTNGGELLITPLLEVAEGESFSFEAARNYGDTSFLNVYYSTDRENWVKVRSLSATAADDADKLSSEYSGISWGDNTKYIFTPFTISSIPAGNVYLAFEAGNARVDNLIGYKKVDVDHDLYFTVLNFPATGMVNNEYTATATVRNLTEAVEEATNYTAVLMCGEDVLAVGESVEIPAFGEAELTFSYTPHATGTTELYILLSGEDLDCKSKTAEVVINEEMMTQDLQVGEANTETSKCAPISLYNNQSESETVYKVSQLGLANGSKITHITFKAYCGQSKNFTGKLTIRLENTEDESPVNIGLDSDKLNAMTTVYDNDNYTFDANTKKSDLISVDLPVPFEYTGKNLRVVLSHSSSGWVTTYFEHDKNCSGQSIYRANDKVLPTSYTASPMPVMYLTASTDPIELSGKVTDAENTPVGNAEIKLESGNVVYTGKSDREGNYTIKVMQPTLEYTVTATAEGMDTYTGTVTFDDGANKTLNIMFSNNIPASVSDIISEEEEVIYDLNGLRLQEKPANGIFIRNGKKYILK
ncbi:MAG: carboxypeptidase regulatory-like domain-containing protein, partial [Muribaculaceae bacterium]|nr:carboxypeptidase regulatory-like domain-containing protein [Muribaculaceae bacterium]